MSVSMPDARWGSRAAPATSAEGGGNALLATHERLAVHFRDLRERRDALGRDVPVFALEHGLSNAELAALETAVRSAARHRILLQAPWLPLVVYATELGYHYSGDEYWQTFEAQTPAWAESGDRPHIRTVFEKFSDTFGGARPSGVWANWFSIISWPITHAVLPTDLQRQFARLLFDSRGALTADLLAAPDLLGLKLAARAGHYSKRFQAFAQNTGLLGQVAAALLADEEETPYLLSSTLRRIAKSLSAERQARKWLQDTRWSAGQVRARGFRRPTRERSGPAAMRQRVLLLPRTTDPVLSLRREQDGWSAYLRLPDLSVLAERLPGIHDELGRLRPRVAGASQTALPRGQLLYPGKPLRLTTWPADAAPLIQLEGGQRSTNDLLAAECVLPPGPPWVFRLRDCGLATEIRGKVVHPGGRYMVLRRDAVKPTCLPRWVTPAGCRTSGVHAYDVRVPPTVDDRHAEEARLLGFAVQADVWIRPAGVVAAAWDGEGTAEWLSGEDVILAVRSTRLIGHCIFEMAGTRRILNWPADGGEVFVTVAGLGTGTHEACVSLLPPGGGEPVAKGTFIVAIRDPSPRPPGGTLGEGLALIASPATPTLPEIWDGRAAIQVLGPPGISVQVEIALADRHQTVIASQTFRMKIPVDLAVWWHFAATRFRESQPLQRAYAEAESCVITVSDRRLGVAQLRCEREFAPLRWIVGAHHGGPFARLIDNTEDGAAVISYFGFSAPDQSTQITRAAGEYLCEPAGGLLKAQAGGFETAAILPPKVRFLADLRQVDIRPQFRQAARRGSEAARLSDTAGEVHRLVEVARMWASAALPQNPLARHERRSVLRAVARRITCLVSGRYWSELEHRARDDAPALSAMRRAFGTVAYQRNFAGVIAGRLGAWRNMLPEERAADLGPLLATHVPRARLGPETARSAELLLRLASDPATLAAWPQNEVGAAIEKVIEVPVLMRAARFVVLAIHAAIEEDEGTTYRGWEWI